MKNFQMLLQGAENIKQMRSDINELTSTMLGMLDPNDVQTEKFIARGPHYRWDLRIYLHLEPGKHERTIAVEFSEMGDKGNKGRLIFSTHPVTKREPALRDVSVIWFALETLTEFLSEFPSFQKKSSPLYSAANVLV